MIIGLIRVLVFQAKRCDVVKIGENPNASVFVVKEIVNMPYAFREELECENINVVKRKIGGKLYNTIFSDDVFGEEEYVLSLLDQHDRGKNIFRLVIIAGLEDEFGELTSLSDDDLREMVDNIKCISVMIHGENMVLPVIRIG